MLETFYENFFKKNTKNNRPKCPDIKTSLFGYGEETGRLRKATNTRIYMKSVKSASYMLPG